MRPVISSALRSLFSGWNISVSYAIPPISCSRHCTSPDSFPLAYFFFWNATLKSRLTTPFMASESTGRTTWWVTRIDSQGKWSRHQACQNSRDTWTMLLSHVSQLPDSAQHTTVHQHMGRKAGVKLGLPWAAIYHQYQLTRIVKMWFKDRTQDVRSFHQLERLVHWRHGTEPI